LQDQRLQGQTSLCYTSFITPFIFLAIVPQLWLWILPRLLCQLLKRLLFFMNVCQCGQLPPLDNRGLSLVTNEQRIAAVAAKLTAVVVVVPIAVLIVLPEWKKP
jgi:hypothetical protein